MSSSRDMAVANFMPLCADFVFICVLTSFLQTAITNWLEPGYNWLVIALILTFKMHLKTLETPNI